MLLRNKISNSIENTKNKKLSIQFSLDGFSFCISDSDGRHLEYASYLFDEKANTPEEILSEIETLFKEEALLQDDFESILVIHENHLSTVVPSIYFKEEALKEYLKFSVKTIRTDFIAYDNIDEHKLKVVYVPYVNINNFLFQHFGEFEFKHHSTVLIEKLIEKGDDNLHFYVNINPSAFDIVVVKEQKLVLSNSFEYQTKEDFIYFVLFTMEQLKCDPDRQEVILLGDITKESELYEIAYTYIRNLSFLAEDESENQSNFILLG